MKTGLTTFAKCFVTGAMLVGTLSVLAQPTLIQTATGGIAPNGMGVTTSELLFSQPYCDGVQPRGVYQANQPFVPGGTGVVDATMTKLFGLPAQTGCSASAGGENNFVISSGLGGFPLNTVYSTSPGSIAGTADVYANAAIFKSGVPDSVAGNYAGITLDTTGKFSNALIVTTADAVFGYNSLGTQVFKYPTPGSGVQLQQSSVAPLSNTCSGCLYIVGSAFDGTSGAIYLVHPGAPNLTVPTLLTAIPAGYGRGPEGLTFVTPTVCTLNGTNFSYFVAGYASGGQMQSGTATNGALLAYTQAQVTPFAGMALMPIELGPNDSGGSILAFDPGSLAFSTFSTPVVPVTSAPFQLEVGTLVACAPQAGGCPATQGYWKKHAMATPTLTIGGITYTDAQLVNILDTAPKGGDATLILLHQLIAALANEAAGARHAGVIEDGVSVDTAIAEAQALLTANGNTTFVAASSTLGQEYTTLSTILDDYNSAVGLNCNEGSGLIGPS